MKLIPLTQGMFTKVDDDMFEYLNQWKWCALKGGNTYYAVRTLNIKKDGKWSCKSIRMHREIMNAKKGEMVDHKYHDGLDNQKSNLRLCTQSENLKNKKSSGTSKYLGVCWINRDKKWQATINLNGKNKNLGLFTNEENAAISYDKAAKIHHGEFANLNFKNK
jgi:hypothetical protein